MRYDPGDVSTSSIALQKSRLRAQSVVLDWNSPKKVKGGFPVEEIKEEGFEGGSEGKKS